MQRFFLEDNEVIHEYLNYAIEIKEWIEKQDVKKIPKFNSEDPEEKRMSELLRILKFRFLRQYVRIETDIEKQIYIKKYPEIKQIIEISEWIYKKKEFVGDITPSLESARKIKKWMEKSKDYKPPRAHCGDKEEEKLGSSLSNLKKFLLASYEGKTDEEKQKFLKIHPEMNEILEILEWIDEVKVPPLLQSARRIKEWLNNNDLGVPNVLSNNQEEVKVANALINIRKKTLNLYLSQDEKEKQKYINEHPEIFEILELLYETHKEGKTIYQRKVAEDIRNDLIYHIEIYSKISKKDSNIILENMRLQNNKQKNIDER